MKIRAIALNTLSNLVRNKLILLVCAGFVCIVLLMMTPMLAAKRIGRTMSTAQTQGMVLSIVSMVIDSASAMPNR